MPQANFDEDCGTQFQLLQRVALIVFYVITSGDNWINNRGWPPLANISTAMSNPARTQTCSRPYQGQVVTELPAHCCWFGVYCCLSSSCSQHDGLLVESCNCSKAS